MMMSSGRCAGQILYLNGLARAREAILFWMFWQADDEDEWQKDTHRDYYEAQMPHQASWSAVE